MRTCDEKAAKQPTSSPLNSGPSRLGLPVPFLPPTPTHRHISPLFSSNCKEVEEELDNGRAAHCVSSLWAILCTYHQFVSIPPTTQSKGYGYKARRACRRWGCCLADMPSLL